LESTKSKHLFDISLPEERDRKALIMGWADNNIGGAIERSLSDRYKDMRIFGIPHEDMAAEHIGDLHELSSFDTLVLVNGQTHLDWIENQPIEEIMNVVHNSLTASIVATREFVSATLSSSYRKHIVYVGSMAYNHVLNASAPYCAAKAGLAHFAKCMAWELAPKNYDVFCVHPSNTQGTPMTDKTIRGIMRYRDVSLSDAYDYWSAVLPKKHWLQPEEIGECVAALVSGKFQYLSGSPIELAGGQR